MRPLIVVCRSPEATLTQLFFPSPAEETTRGEWASVDLSSLSTEHLLESGVLYLGDGSHAEDTLYFTLSLRRDVEDLEQVVFIVEGASDRDLAGYTMVRLIFQSAAYESPLTLISNHELRSECTVPLSAVLDRRHRRIAKPIMLQIV